MRPFEGLRGTPSERPRFQLTLLKVPQSSWWSYGDNAPSLRLPPAHVDVTVGGLAGLIDTAVRIGLGGHRFALPLAGGLDVHRRDLGGQVVRDRLRPLLGERLVVSVVGYGVRVPHHGDRGRWLAVPALDDLVEHLFGPVGQGRGVDVEGDTSGQ